LAVASKAAGFVALINVVLVALPPQADVVQPLMWVLSAVTMTVGNLIAIRQTNIVRMLAYSGVAQAGYMLAPLAVFGQEFNDTNPANAIVNYLLVYAAMNFGAFAVVLLVARKTRSGEISSYGGLMNYAPGLGAAMTIFLFSLAGIPPVGGWWAKFQIFNVLTQNASPAGITLAVIAAVNSVIAAFYYLNVAKQMWFVPEPNEDHTPISFPAPLATALAITVVATIVFGILPGITGDLSDFTSLAAR
jgi:NADH-quinone oxidoreductase subunit N